MPEPRESPRWQHLFRESTDPLAILDGRRRVRFVNAAFEAWSGVAFAELRGRVCRRRSQPADVAEALLTVLTPPEGVAEGAAAEVRRRVALSTGAAWVDCQYLPFAADGAGFAVAIRLRPAMGQGPLPALPDRLVQIQHAARSRYRLDELDGRSPEWTRLAAQLRLAAAGRHPIHFHGPPGSGKEHWARTLHLAGPRANLPFAALDARLLPAFLIEAFLFDPDRIRRFGCVLVKHPELMPHEVQVRWAETLAGSDGPRWMAATLQPASASWQPDLAAALQVFVISVPPLVSAEIPTRLASLLPAACEAAGKPPLQLSEAAIETLVRHSWLNHVAELATVLREAALRARGEQIEVGDLPFHLRAEPILEETPIRLDEVLEQTERRLIQQALRKFGNNKAKAAESLGIWRARLLRRIEQLGLRHDEEPPAAE